MSRDSAELKRQFAEAVALSGNARIEFLARLRARDQSMAKDVESLLAYDDSVAELVAKAAEEIDRRRAELMSQACREHPEHAEEIRRRLGASGSGTAPRTSGESGGDAIGAYRPIRELGRGGQAVVYLAEDMRLRRQVALKVLKGFGPLSDNVMARFRREAEVTSKMDHPGICAVYDTGVEGGVPYIAMRFVPGETLAAKIAAAKGSSAEEFAVSTDGEVSSNGPSAPGRLKPAVQTGLSMTHAQILALVEIVEKTARALHAAHEAGVIHRDIKPGNVMVSPDGQPVILDFGLASDEEGDFRTLTQSGDLFGTPAYMSPEQLMAQRVRLDRRTDVYSLGVTLFECLALRQPFDAPTREGMYQAIQYKEPPDVRKLNTHVPKDLKVVIETALQKDRDKRYATAQAFAEDLRRVRASEPITAKPVGPIGRVVRFAKRRPAMATLIGVLILAIPIIAGLSGFLVANWDEIEQQKQRAIDEEVERELETGYLELADGTPDNAISAFDRALALKAQSAEAVAGKVLALLRQGRGQEALATIEGQKGTHESEDAFQILRADALEQLGQKNPAEDIRRRLTRPTTLLGLFLGGQRDLSRGDASYGSDQDAYQRAVEPLGDAVARAPVARLLFHGSLLRAAGRAKRADMVRRLVPALLALWPDSGWAHYQAGYALDGIDDTDGALAAYRRAIELNPKLGGAHNNLGLQLKKKGQIDDAIAEFRLALEIDPKFVVVHANLGMALKAKGQIDDAIAEYRRAIEIDPRYALAHNNLGFALKAKGQIDDAIAEYRRAIEIDPRYALAHNNLGLALKAKGQIDDAIAEFRRAIEINPKYAIAHNDLGRALAEKGQVDEAIAAYRRAIEIDPTYANAHTNLGVALFAKGLIDEAIAECRRAIELDPKAAIPHHNLAGAFKRKGLMDEAIAEYRRAIELDPKCAAANNDLGRALVQKGRVDEAIARFRRAIEIESNDALAQLAHYYLGNALRHKGLMDEAIVEFRRAIVLDPKDGESHNNLGLLLEDAGRINEAIAEYRRAIEAAPKLVQPRLNLDPALVKATSESQLDHVVSGGVWPETAEDLAMVALVASGRDLHALAARMWARAFTEQPGLADDREARWRDRAARSAVLAAASIGGDSAALDEKARSELREHGREWLTDEMVGWLRRVADEESETIRTEARWAFERWKTDPKLASVRDAAELAKLPEPEREAWKQLWAEIDAKLAERSK